MRPHNFASTIDIFIIIILFLCVQSIEAQSSEGFVEIKRFSASEARQGVAVDATYVYVIGTQEIGKYDKHTGMQVTSWKATENEPIIHLDSGVIVEGKLYCAHSNYPGIPMTSSVEIWDAETLQHIDSHSFGIRWGSCTWIDRFQGFWWAAFAHYEKFKAALNTDNKWTTLVKFDDNWNSLEEWVFPSKVLEMFAPMSNSGASWGADGLLYCTGHDRPEIVTLRLPKAGSVLELVRLIPTNSLGQDRQNGLAVYLRNYVEKFCF